MRILHDHRSNASIESEWYSDATCAAVLCASICRRWRALALSFPWLWNHVYVNIAAGSQATRNLIALQFQRSEALPLDLSIDCHDAAPQKDTFRDILRQSARWRTFRFSYHVWGDVFHRFQRPTPLLELFSLQSEYHPIHGPYRCLRPGEAVVFLPYAPRLRTLEIPACALHRIPLIPRPSLQRL
ncbi:hypothetical protein AURDEDRAFT_116974, partial [Auricularia subglabra TFB-10046 SS5]